jgi:hypothetical protein
MTGGQDGDAVTVVVVAHDATATIDATLGSIAGQLVPPAAVVLVDDGSRDDTAARAERWRGHLPLRIERRVTNDGVGAARAYAMTRVETPLVASLDADDVWLPDHLGVVLSAYSPGCLVVARDILWSPGAWLRPSPRRLPRPEEQVRAITNGTLASASVLYAHHDQERVGGYRPSLRRSEDWDLYLRMARAGIRVVLAAEPSFLYRISPGSLSAGYATVESDIAVLEHARQETTQSDELRWIEAALRQRLARHSLAESFKSARNRQSSDARRAARQALKGGTAKTRLLATAVIATPRTSTRLRDARSARRWSG